MEKYFYERKIPDRNLEICQYIYHIGQYRYNWHKALEIFLVIKGTVELSCGGKTVLMEEDDFMVINSNVGHASLAKKENSIAMVIHLEPEYLKAYFGQMKEWIFEGNTNSQNRYCSQALEIRGIMSDLMYHGEAVNPLESLEYEQKLNRLLSLLFYLFEPKRQEITECLRTKKQQNLIEQILNYVEENYKERLSLHDLGKVCPYNSSYLSVYFKNHVGVNFYDYLTRIRVREATLELCSTESTVLEIAHNNGFPDVKAFNTAFKKTFGKSPMQYRQQILAEDRGKELLEKRTFLSTNNELLNIKLENYRYRAKEYEILDFVYYGKTEKYEEKLKNLKQQAQRSCEEVEKLQKILDDFTKESF